MTGEGPSLARRLRERSAWLLVVIGVLAADQATKAAVVARVEPGEVVPVIPGFFSLTLVHNTGGVWGTLQGVDGAARVLLFLALPVLITVLATVHAASLPVADRARLACVAAVVGGAVGNLVDRLRLGKVVDFLLFEVRGLAWPTFNVADSAICVGVAVLLALAFSHGEARATPASHA